MASVNKVILVGNCGRDPEMRYLPSGQAVANVSVATSTRRKDKNSGEMVEDTQWHRVTFYDRLAEIAGEYVKKGRPLYVEGRIKSRQWQAEDGTTKYTTEIQVTEFTFLTTKKEVEALKTPQNLEAKPANFESPNTANPENDLPF